MECPRGSPLGARLALIRCAERFTVADPVVVLATQLLEVLRLHDTPCIRLVAPLLQLE